MSETEFERHVPQHPLPEDLQKMKRDDTVCKFCGVSYLIHREIKALEDKLKETEKELAHYKGCESRELEAKAELLKIQSQLEQSSHSLSAKDEMLNTAKNEIKHKNEEIDQLKASEKKLQDMLSDAVHDREQNNSKLLALQRSLPGVMHTVKQQQKGLNHMRSVVKENENLMKEQCNTMGKIMQEILSRHDQETNVLQSKLHEMEEEKEALEVTTRSLKSCLENQEKDLGQLKSSEKQILDLKNIIRGLREEISNMQSQLDSATSKSRSLNMESEQYKEQVRAKNQELENLSQQMKNRDHVSDQNIAKLQHELKQKSAELQMTEKECQQLKKKFLEQQRLDEEMRRRATMFHSESQEMRLTLQKAQDDLAALKAERELMITSHQNRIEQLRESFKNKMYEAEKWPEKLEAALTKERKKHSAELKALEESLKENFVMELQIEKQKHQELLNKYKSEAREAESKLRDQLNGAGSKLRVEVEDLKRQLREAKKRAQEMEESLRQEIESLKAIIRDLENRLGKLDTGNEEKVVHLKSELKHKELELAESHEENRKLEDQVTNLKEEIIFLQETVRRECEERFELTEALSEAKEQLLTLKRPPGGYHSSSPQNSAGSSGRRSNQLNDSLSNSNRNINMPKSSSEEMLIFKKRQSSKSHPPNKQTDKELTQSVTMGFEGESQEVGTGKLKGSSLSSERKRVAGALGKR